MDEKAEFEQLIREREELESRDFRTLLPEQRVRRADLLNRWYFAELQKRPALYDEWYRRNLRQRASDAPPT